jgi:hypothetical protein
MTDYAFGFQVVPPARRFRFGPFEPKWGRMASGGRLAIGLSGFSSPASSP